MSESDKILIESWFKLYGEIMKKLNTVQNEKEMANYPITQDIEDWMHIAHFTIGKVYSRLDEFLRDNLS